MSARNIRFQIDLLKKLYLKANIVDPTKEDPWNALKRVDWTLVNSGHSLTENLTALKTKYPKYKWPLYEMIDEVLRDELSHWSEHEVKPFEQKTKDRICRRGRIQVIFREDLIGKKVRIVFIESLEDYIRNWQGRVRTGNLMDF
jgi:hypothetical protein